MAENFRSIDNKIELSFEADTGIKDRGNEGVSLIGGKRVLNAAAFFGANSSGKSNVFNAVDMMRLMVVYSVKLNDNERLPYDPYLLSDRESVPTRAVHLKCSCNVSRMSFIVMRIITRMVI